ncbi:DUF4129 domain-containing protein [Streptomyces sp. NPDC008317]|uniref:DUF4129 domain-containing protein n=1 Tax=Streptomyces sp. NPDC008317 TaxID=3364827 RepID=UPI0036ED175E
MGRAGNGGGPRTSAGARAALGVLVIAGLALSALVLRPEGKAFGKGGGPLGGNVFVVALGLAWFIGALMLHNRYVLQVGDDAESDPLRQRLVDVVRAALLGAAFVVPLLIFVMHRFHASGRTSGGGKDRKWRDATAPTPSAPTPPRPLKRHQDNHGFPSWLTHVLIGIGIGLLVLAVVLAAVLLWRYLRSGEAERQDGPGYDQADDEDELLAEAVESGRRALRDDADARAAVIACYAAMERSLAASGIARRASDSPQDLLERAVTAGRLAGPSAAALTALFREARYSTHPMDDGHRDRAARALTEIAAQLAPDEAASGDGGGPGERTTEAAAEAAQ